MGWNDYISEGRILKQIRNLKKFIRYLLNSSDKFIKNLSNFFQHNLVFL